MPPYHDVAIWCLCAVAIAGILVRPFGIAEWVWVTGASALVACAGLLTPAEIGLAITNGTDVYLFLAGMMLLAETARAQGVFDWLASYAVRVAGGSPARLFALVYAVGIVVTTVLSNDATAVVLTPAVATAVRSARAQPLPYLFACALIANAASFVLPISNPANLVVFAGRVPPLSAWLSIFLLPSMCAIVTTYVVLRAVFARELVRAVSMQAPSESLRAGGRTSLAGIAVTACALLWASSFGAPLGIVTAACAVGVLCAVALTRANVADVARGVSWSTIALVAGLFVLVAAAERTGLLRSTSGMMRAAGALPVPVAVAATGFAAALASNVINNLPAGLIAGTTLAHVHVGNALRGAVAIGIDLGPNLSVTGSLATILWLLALRREKIDVDAWQFLKVGALAMPPALLIALESTLLQIFPRIN